MNVCFIVLHLNKKYTTKDKWWLAGFYWFKRRDRQWPRGACRYRSRSRSWCWKTLRCTPWSNRFLPSSANRWTWRPCPIRGWCQQRSLQCTFQSHPSHRHWSLHHHPDKVLGMWFELRHSVQLTSPKLTLVRVPLKSMAPSDSSE